MDSLLLILITAVGTTALCIAVFLFLKAQAVPAAVPTPLEPSVEPEPSIAAPPQKGAVQSEGEAEIEARRILIAAMQRLAAPVATESTSEFVPLPSEDIKGRIIGREGRNIRAFEQVTGVDLLIDETPGGVVISTFDPFRREVARQTLLKLVQESKIQPARIEETHQLVVRDMEKGLLSTGQQAAKEAGAGAVNAKITEALGRLKYRTSYSQNVLQHSIEVALLAGFLAQELGLPPEKIRRAGLLHDIGKALGPEWEGPHALAGMSFLKSCGEQEPVLQAVGAHHFEIEPATPEALLVIIADQISAARPGARRETLEQFVQRVSALESIAKAFDGVESAFAVQAGRELRVLVKPEALDDRAAAQLAHDLARKIESELPANGQVKVTVIRETRIHEVAKPN